MSFLHFKTKSPPVPQTLISIAILNILDLIGPQNQKNLDLKSMDQYLSFWNLMAYDYAGSWDQTAGHQANVHPSHSNPSATPFSTSHALHAFREAGIPPSKVVIGLPLYGRAFTQTEGLGRPFQGVGEGSWEQGVWDAKALPRPGAEEHWDDEAKASYSYDRQAKVLVSYDTKHAAGWKADWIKTEGLGGAMWWESSGDGAGEASLISHVSRLLLHTITTFSSLLLLLRSWSSSAVCNERRTRR